MSSPSTWRADTANGSRRASTNQVPGRSPSSGSRSSIVPATWPETRRGEPMTVRISCTLNERVRGGLRPGHHRPGRGPCYRRRPFGLARGIGVAGRARRLRAQRDDPASLHRRPLQRRGLGGHRARNASRTGGPLGARRPSTGRSPDGASGCGHCSLGSTGMFVTGPVRLRAGAEHRGRRGSRHFGSRLPTIGRSALLTVVSTASRRACPPPAEVACRRPELRDRGRTGGRRLLGAQSRWQLPVERPRDHQSQNEGIAAGASEFIVVTHDDCTVSPDWIAVAGRLLDPGPGGSCYTGRARPLRAPASCLDDHHPAPIADSGRNGI